MSDSQASPVHRTDEQEAAEAAMEEEEMPQEEVEEEGRKCPCTTEQHRIHLGNTADDLLQHTDQIDDKSVLLISCIVLLRCLRL